MNRIEVPCALLDSRFFHLQYSTAAKGLRYGSYGTYLGSSNRGLTRVWLLQYNNPIDQRATCTRLRAGDNYGKIAARIVILTNIRTSDIVTYGTSIYLSH